MNDVSFAHHQFQQQSEKTYVVRKCRLALIVLHVSACINRQATSYLTLF